MSRSFLNSGTLIVIKILSVTLFKELVAAFRNLPVIIKLAPELSWDSENYSESANSKKR
jgi:hypothetical protein